MLAVVFPVWLFWVGLPVVFVVGSVVGIILAVMFYPDPRTYSVPVLSVRRTIDSPLVTIPFEQFPTRFLPELRQHLAVRLSSEADAFRISISKESDKRLPFEEIEKFCDLAKTLLETLEKKKLKQLFDLADAIRLKVDAQAAGTEIGLAIASLAVATTVSAIAILGACAALLASLQNSDDTARIMSKLNELIAERKMEEIALFQGLYESAQGLIAARRLTPGTVDNNQFHLRVLKSKWLQRFQSEVENAPTIKSRFFISEPTQASLQNFENAIERASNYLYYSFLGTYVDFFICDAIEAPEIFKLDLENDIRAFERALVALDRRLNASTVKKPRSKAVRDGIQERLKLLEQLHAAVSSRPPSVPHTTVPPPTFEERLKHLLEALLKKMNVNWSS